MSIKETTGAACCPYKEAATGFVAILLAAAVVGLGVGYLGSDLWAMISAHEESSAAAVVAAAEQTLPVDAPTVNFVRSTEQAVAASQSSSGSQDGVVVLNDWTYTQASSSPFLFAAPNGFDFFNPLFALDFVASPSTSSTSSSSTPATTPFGFNIVNNFSIPIVTSSGGTTTIVTNQGNGSTTGGTSGTAVVPVTGGSSGGTSTGTGKTTTTTSVGFLNGAEVFVTVSVTTVVVQSVPIGSASMSHRHAVIEVIVVVNVVVVNVSPSS